MAQQLDIPAFPTVVHGEHSDDQGKDYFSHVDPGMTLRDYFAGQAIVGLLGRHTVVLPDTVDEQLMDRLAYTAWDMADDLLRAREEMKQIVRLGDEERSK